jgi:mRNA interferase MazF
MPSFDPATLKRWDVVVLAFPYSDRLAEKRRPALVVSGEALQRRHALLWVVMITSEKASGWDGDVPVSDLGRAGLPAPSVVRPAKIACIEPARVLRTAGNLPEADARRVHAALAALLR